MKELTENTPERELRTNEKKSTKRIDRKNTTTTTTARARARIVSHDLAHRLTLHTRLYVVDVVAAAAHIRGMTRDEAIDWIDYMDEVGYVFSDGGAVNRRNFRRSLRMWHKTAGRIAADSPRKSREEERREAEARLEAAKRKRVESAALKPEAWELCHERCANWRVGGGCACEKAIPPNLLNPPRPPEDCDRFERVGDGRDVGNGRDEGNASPATPASPASKETMK